MMDIMDRKTYLKYYAVSIIFLFVFLPVNFAISVSGFTNDYGPGGGLDGGSVNSPSASEEFVSIQSISGRDGHQGFRRRNDVVEITAQASLGEGINVEPSNLEVFFSGFAMGQFRSCTKLSNQSWIYSCSFTEMNGTGPATTSKQNYEVRLVDGGEVVASTSKEVLVDSYPPSILKLDPESEITNEDNISVSFRVKDYASSGITGIGIDQASLSLGNNDFYEYSHNESSQFNTRTSLSETIDVNLGSSSGDYQLCLTASDLFGHEDSECKTIVLDKNAPLILGSTYKLFDQQDNPIGWLSDDRVELSAYVEIEADDLNTGSIKADFSDFLPGSSQSSITPSGGCIKVQDKNNTYGCTFDFSAELNSSRQYEAVFYAEDILGNSVERTLRKSIDFDNEGPEPQELSTPYYYNNRYYLGEQPANITVDYLEQGVGMNNSEAYLDLSDVGLSKVKASNCTVGGRCIWENVAIRGSISNLQDIELEANDGGQSDSIEVGVDSDEEGSYETITFEAKEAKIISSSTTKDDLGNNANPKNFDIGVDIEDPVINSVNITTISGSDDFSGNIVVGDSIDIRINVTDGTPVEMNITSDDFLNDSRLFSTTRECEDMGDGTHICSYTFGPITKEGYYEGKFDVKLTDLTGNEITVDDPDLSFDVLEIIEEIPDYWDATIDECSPDPLDRKLVEIYSSDIYCSANLEADSDVEIYDLSGGGCIDAGAESELEDLENISTIKQASWLGTARNSRGLYVNILTNTFNPRVDKVNYICQINVRSIVGGKRVTREYETVNASFSVGLYDDPLGEVDDALWNKVSSVYDTYADGWELVGQLNSFFEMSKKLCDIANKIIGLVSKINDISKLWGELTDLIPGLLGAKESSATANLKLDLGIDGMSFTVKKIYLKFFSKYCNFISCRLLFSDVNEDTGIADNPIGQWQQFWVEGFSLLSNPIPGIKAMADGDESTTLGSTINKSIKAKYGKGSGEITRAYELARDEANATKAGIIGDYVREKGNKNNREEYDELVDKYNTGKIDINKFESGVGNLYVGGSKVNESSNEFQTYLSDHPTKRRIYQRASSTLKQEIINLKEYDKTFAGDDFIEFGTELKGAPADPRENYILSVFTLCLPGIIYNLQKIRSIQCTYGSCMLNSPSTGVPTSLCEENRAYAECKFIYGSLFELMPFSQLLSKLQAIVAKIVTDPIFLGGVVLEQVCTPTIFAKWGLCKSPTPGPCFGGTATRWMCFFKDTFGFFSQLKQDLEGFTEEGFWDISVEDECNEFMDKYDNMKKGSSD